MKNKKTKVVLSLFLMTALVSSAGCGPVNEEREEQSNGGFRGFLPGFLAGQLLNNSNRSVETRYIEREREKDNSYRPSSNSSKSVTVKNRVFSKVSPTKTSVSSTKSTITRSGFGSLGGRSGGAVS